MAEDAHEGEHRCHAQLWDQVMEVKALSGLRKVRHRGEMQARYASSNILIVVEDR